MTSTFDIALVEEQGVDFAVVNVKRHVLDDARAQEDLAATLIPHVGAIPIVFMSQDSRGEATYVGRRDIVRFLANIFVEQLPWRTATLRS